MNNQFAQSENAKFYTPNKRSHQADKFDSDKMDKSTADKFYDLEDSFKHYEELLQENLYLKGLMLKENVVEKTRDRSQARKSSNNQSHNHSDQFELKYGRNSSSTKCLSTGKGFNQSMPLQLGQDDRYRRQNQCCNDMTLWAVKQRNKFLQQKLNTLKNQYSKQTNSIKKVVTSQKWKNRFNCTQMTCYQDKYIQLLRVKSPVFLQ